MLVDAMSFATAFLGGLLIGAAALVLLLGLGRIAGISGILANVWDVTGSGVGRFWRLAFLLGLVGVAPIVEAAGWGRAAPPLEDNLLVLVGAGLLVGYGTRLGSGCTSGHAVCGLARFSRRSLVATMIFMLSAGAIVFLRRHLIGA